MIRRFTATLLAATAIGVVASQGASAADLVPRKAPPPVVVPPPVYNWTGFYVGGHVGAGFAREAWQDRGLCLSEGFCPSNFGDTSDVGSHNAIGVLGGFTVGYNWQAPGNHWVWGIEGEWSFADLKGDHSNSATASFLNFGDFDETAIPTTATLNDRFSTHVEDIATIAGRIGWTSDAGTLFFIKGGGAYAREQHSVSSTFAVGTCPDLSDNDCRATNGSGFWSGSQSHWGWMVGTGLEFALFDTWTAKVEYDYLGFGGKDITLNGSASACTTFSFDGTLCGSGNGSTRTFHINENIQEIKIGLNYRFNGWLWQH